MSAGWPGALVPWLVGLVLLASTAALTSCAGTPMASNRSHWSTTTLSTRVATAPSTTAGGSSPPPTATATCDFTNGTPGSYVLVGNPDGCVAQISVGQRLSFDLAPIEASGGRTEQHSNPDSNNPVVLKATSLSVQCPIGDTCATFVGVGVGHAVVSWIPPGGCGGGKPCVLVRHKEVEVIVTA